MKRETIPTEHAVRWRADQDARVERVWKDVRNETRAKRRKSLYHDDPIWRLTKLKDNRERRLRAKRAKENAAGQPIA